MSKYKNEEEIRALVEAFERGMIAESEWRHAEHLVVGLDYLTRFAFDAALARMRAGIFDLLRAFKIDLAKEMPYHETLTVFWMRAIDEFRRAHDDLSPVEITGRLIDAFDKDYPLRFYSRELLFSDRARRAYVAPDLPRGKI